MIVVDASAVVAIIRGEPERDAFATAIIDAGRALISPINVWEVLARAHGAGGPEGRAAAQTLLDALGLVTSEIGLSEAQAAADAFARFGRPTPAGLNLGDCFAYALARAHDAPLLFKGEDFLRTDVKRADY